MFLFQMSSTQSKAPNTNNKKVELPAISFISPEQIVEVYNKLRTGQKIVFSPDPKTNVTVSDTTYAETRGSFSKQVSIQIATTENKTITSRNFNIKMYLEDNGSYSPLRTFSTQRSTPGTKSRSSPADQIPTRQDIKLLQDNWNRIVEEAKKLPDVR